MGLGQSGFSCWELIFVIFRKLRSNGLITFSFLKQIKTIWPRKTDCGNHCHSVTITSTPGVTDCSSDGSRMTRLPLDALSTGLSIVFSSSKQIIQISSSSSESLSIPYSISTIKIQRSKLLWENFLR